MPEESSAPPNRPLEFTRHENFESWYANNVQFEPNEFDLRMVFGENESLGGKRVVQQHTAMSVSWAEAKILAYFLQLHIAAAEKVNGKINVPRSVWPTEPIPPSEELKRENPLAESIYQMAKQMHERFIANL